jgi:predicted ArsR family transcriptional regulator
VQIDLKLIVIIIRVPVSQVNPDIEAIGALHDPQRRAVYTFVSQQRHDVSRDEAAEALSISRSLAAFHLERLVQAGLLDALYRRLTGRQGPGAGRPSKLYRRTGRQIRVSVPERRYELLAQLFARALHEAQEARVKTVLARAARTFGQALAAPYRSGRTASRGSARTLREVLAGLGGEPYAEGRVLRLRNCPFDTAATTYPELVCGTNLRLVEGVISGLGMDRIKARLDPGPGRCCVAIAPSSTEGGRNA